MRTPDALTVVRLRSEVREKTLTLCEHFEELESIEHYGHQIVNLSVFGTLAAVLAMLVAAYEILVD